jgi:hypothetical protein
MSTNLVHEKFDPRAEFEAFVKGQHARAEAETADWHDELPQWLKSLDELYDRLSGYLSTYIQSGQIDISYREVELNEDNLGTYSARQMIVRIGRQEIRLSPVGTLLIGAKGRVDIAGPVGRARLVLVDSKVSAPRFRVNVTIGGASAPDSSLGEAEEIVWAWKIATSPPRIQYVDLSADTFFQVLIEVSNG